MCAVLDASVSGEVFRPNREPIADLFFEWMNRPSPHPRLIVGGEQLRELRRNADAARWLENGIRAGRVVLLDPRCVEAKTRELEQRRDVQSDDPHVLAVALLSGVRVLFSNDVKLQADFKNPAIVNKPAGRIYTSQPVPVGHGKKVSYRPRQLTQAHKRMLADPDLCSGCRL